MSFVHILWEREAVSMKKKSFFLKKRGIVSRVSSVILVFAMMFSLLQNIPGSLWTIWASESEAGQEQLQLQASEEVTIRVHYKNTSARWGSVYGYAWPDGGIYGGWPGSVLTENADHPGYYTLEFTKPAAHGFNCIFNNGSGAQTADLSIAESALTASDGVYECWVYDNTAQSVSEAAPDGWDPAFISPQVSGRTVTFRYKDAGASVVSVAGTMNDWALKAMNKSGDVYSVQMTMAPGVYGYKFVVGSDWIFDPSNDKTVLNEGTQNSRVVVSGICDKTIEITKNSPMTLPGTLEAILPDGTPSTQAVTYALKTANTSGVTLDTTTNKITVGSAYTADTLELTASGEDGSQATVTLSVSTDPNAFVSPEINGNIVTFRYKSDSAQKVSLAGSMYDWAPKEMSDSDGDGIYTYTTEALQAGSYEYKFIVDDQWTTDPKNYNALSVSGNNVFHVAGLVAPKMTTAKGRTTILPAQLSVLDESGRQTPSDVTYTLKTSAQGVSFQAAKRALTIDEGFAGDRVEFQARSGNLSVDFAVEVVENADTITVKLHYTRADNDYTDWNVWAWPEGKGGAAYSFEEENGEQVAEITLEGRATARLGYIIRKGDWLDKDIGDDRFIDLTNVLSGTVHYYVSSGVRDGRIDTRDAVTGIKILSAVYVPDTNQITVTTGMPVAVDADRAFTIRCSDGTAVAVTGVSTGAGNQYTLSLGTDLNNIQALVKSYFISYTEDAGYEYPVATPSVYSSQQFEDQYSYAGNDLGAVWTKDKTTFKVWAPTADALNVRLYRSGTEGTDDLIESLPMTMNDKGVWTAVKTGDLNGIYYTYEVTVNGEVTEACDPYARTTGVNGKRAMVIDLDSTDPAGWEDDFGPNKGMTYTDSVIYELHVRDFSIDASSGISNKGKFLGLTEKGTVSTGGQTTGLDYLVDLGVTHIHLLPSYDYGSVDESKLNTPQYNWGYDPVNYNVPEGSYSTDPYNGAVRVQEMKEMVKALHDSNINVIMDVVYNHVYDADTFCFNQLVPKYFSRTNADGSYSNGSGCGNDTASEREMVKKYIVDSVNYWADEYHIDGFRFDLVGLLDTKTINEVVDTVHQKHPDVVFYGEGWTMGTAVSKDGYTMATQQNAGTTPYFAYFSDTIRDLLKGSNDETSLGFVSGRTGQEEAMAKCFTAATSWCPGPTQTVNYASCHDNYTLKDKLNVSRSDASEADRIKMNNLAAAFYLTSEGIPLIHAGEELLRTKVDENGTIIHNSYNSPDYVNSIKWSSLDNAAVREVRDYYRGLIEFRKNHAALRLTTAADVAQNVRYVWLNDNVIMFVIDGKNVADEVSDGIVVIFNAADSEQTVDLYAAGRNVPQGDWKVCVNDKKAGIDVLSTVTDGSVTVAPISAMVLVQGETEDTDSVYVKNSVRPVTSITLDQTTLALEIGQTATLTASVRPQNATNPGVKWESSNDAVVSVADGVVTAKAVGTATITVTALDGSGKSASCVVTVSEKAPGTPGGDNGNTGGSTDVNSPSGSTGGVIFDGIPAEENYEADGTQMRRFRSTNGSNIIVTGPASILPSGLHLYVELLKEDAGAYKKAAEAAARLSGIGNYKVFDISLKDANGIQLHQLAGYVEVTMPIPEGIDGARAVVYRLEDDGSLTKCSVTVGNGYLTFKTNHFSTFVIAEDANAVVKTGDDTPLGLWLFLLLGSSIGLAVLVIRWRRDRAR